MPKFDVTFTIDAEDVTHAQVKEYVDEAVQSWGGQYSPRNPFFGDNKKITGLKVVLHRKPKKKVKT